MKRMPQPIPYQGSKRNIARQILAYFPSNVNTLIEPFGGSAAVTVAAAFLGKAQQFHINDINQPLMILFEAIINKPKEIADKYEELWHAQIGREKEFYYIIREEFNRTHQPDYFLYLLARCVKASVRYNRDGEFNQSPDNRRKGRRPESMRKEIYRVSNLLHGRTTITSVNYQDIFDSIRSLEDLMYLDPPYQGTSGKKDPRYHSSLHLNDLIVYLEALNQRRAMIILSYDGRTGSKTYGEDLPADLNFYKIEIPAGRSTQSTLLGGSDLTYESLYLSPALVSRLNQERPDWDQNSNFGAYDGVRQLELGIV